MLGAVGSLMLILSDPAAAGAPEWRIRCDVGPIERTFAGRPWTVYSCSDGRSLALFAEGSHPHRFVFTLIADGGRYLIGGSGSGDGRVIAAANEELRRLTPDEIAALVGATRAR